MGCILPTIEVRVFINNALNVETPPIGYDRRAQTFGFMRHSPSEAGSIPQYQYKSGVVFVF
uniref:hypothetical protein n=1 Tax=Brasilonema sp. UFV-L1 TaxID=2234130 RepID=UPI0030DA8802